MDRQRSKISLPLGLAAVAAVATLACGQSWARAPGAHPHQKARWPVARRAFKLDMPADLDVDPPSGAWGETSVAGVQFQPDQLPTAVNYRLAPRGPIGTFGFQRPADLAPRSNLGQPQPMRYGIPEVTVGAKVSLPF